MSFTKRDYTSGQTAITADNLNAIQDELVGLKTGGLDGYLDTYLKNRCKYYSVSDKLSASSLGYLYGSALTITEPGIYLVIGFDDLDYSTNDIVNVGVRPKNDGATPLFQKDGRGTAYGGGGVFSINIYSCSANTTLNGYTYIYSPQSGKYTNLTVFAIRLN